MRDWHVWVLSHETVKFLIAKRSKSEKREEWKRVFCCALFKSCGGLSFDQSKT